MDVMEKGENHTLTCLSFIFVKDPNENPKRRTSKWTRPFKALWSLAQSKAASRICLHILNTLALEPSTSCVTATGSLLFLFVLILLFFLIVACFLTFNRSLKFLRPLCLLLLYLFTLFACFSNQVFLCFVHSSSSLSPFLLTCFSSLYVIVFIFFFLARLSKLFLIFHFISSCSSQVSFISLIILLFSVKFTTSCSSQSPSRSPSSSLSSSSLIPKFGHQLRRFNMFS